MMMRWIALILALLLCGAGAAIDGQDYLRLAELQRAQNLSWVAAEGYEKYGADILNASADMAPRISDGSYDSTKYEIPLGPYRVSYELRSEVGFSKPIYAVNYLLHNETFGEGKNYHKNEYEIYWLRTNNLEIAIIHNLGTKKTEQAEMPVKFIFDTFQLYNGRKLEVESMGRITIDGKPGTRCVEAKWNKRGDKIMYSQYEYWYVLDPKTIVAANVWGLDWAKDVSLFEETLHVQA